MSIPQAQLETWSHQGSITQSANTYRTIKSALEARGTGYNSREFEVFLQGSYGNDTNIYAESDVDVVIRCNDNYFYDLSNLPPAQVELFNSRLSAAAYPYSTYKLDVEKALRAQFGSDVKPDKKAIRIEATQYRRSSDVIPAVTFRRFYRYNGPYDQDYREGISFFKSDGERIDNFPKQHSANLTTKHQQSLQNFKPIVRIFKNIRSVLVDRNIITRDIAPSYFIEGLLYNVPSVNFAGTYSQVAYACLKYLTETDRSNFVCANDLFYLLRNSSVTWSAEKCQTFLNATVALWNSWS